MSAETRTRKMWVIVDKYLDRDAQLYNALDGALYRTKPIPSQRWLKTVRVVVTITAIVKERAK